jgi:hypothetical protein
MTEQQPTWTLNGTVLIACNCDYGCPCNFNARPSHGKCEGGWTWHVERGSFDSVSLDGVNFSVYANWPGAIHEGDGEAIILVDERANARQRDAIAMLVSGKVGGPWGVLAWTWATKVQGPLPVQYDLQLNGTGSRLKAGNVVELESMVIKNPVSGKDAHPRIILPEGIVVKEAALGCSKVFRIDEGVPMDHTGQYTAVGAFQYAFP